VYKKRSYGYFSTMRANVVDLIAQPELDRLASYIVEGKSPVKVTRPTKQEIEVHMGRHKVNADQARAIQTSL
jgi:hypothetical protein